jgi:hypothetical protein
VQVLGQELRGVIADSPGTVGLPNGAREVLESGESACGIDCRDILRLVAGATLALSTMR